jgi:hypothetical protein
LIKAVERRLTLEQVLHLFIRYFVGCAAFTDCLYGDQTKWEKCCFLLVVEVTKQSSFQHLQPYFMWSGL